MCVLSKCVYVQNVCTFKMCLLSKCFYFQNVCTFKMFFTFKMCVLSKCFYFQNVCTFKMFVLSNCFTSKICVLSKCVYFQNVCTFKMCVLSKCLYFQNVCTFKKQKGLFCPTALTRYYSLTVFLSITQSYVSLPAQIAATGKLTYKWRPSAWWSFVLSVGVERWALNVDLWALSCVCCVGTQNVPALYTVAVRSLLRGEHYVLSLLCHNTATC
jgi:hypothetical protein